MALEANGGSSGKGWEYLSELSEHLASAHSRSISKHTLAHLLKDIEQEMEQAVNIDEIKRLLKIYLKIKVYSLSLRDEDTDLFVHYFLRGGAYRDIDDFRHKAIERLQRMMVEIEED